MIHKKINLVIKVKIYQHRDDQAGDDDNYDDKADGNNKRCDNENNKQQFYQINTIFHDTYDIDSEQENTNLNL